MSVTIKKIAELAGVSRGTVDRALNNRPGVREEVRLRILEISNTLDYKPNIVGQALVRQKKPYNIGVILPLEKNNKFYKKIYAGMYFAEKEIKDLGFNIIYEYSREYNIDDQIECINNLIKKNISALAFVPIDNEMIKNKINEISNKIKVLTYVTDLEDVKKHCFVGVDAEKSGRIAGDLLTKILPDKANIIIITTSKFVLAQKLRMKGVYDIIANSEKKIKVLEVYENFDHEELTFECIMNAFSKYKKIDGIYLATGLGVDGLGKALKIVDLDKKVKVVAADLIDETIELLRNNVIDFTITQQPFNIGYKTIKNISNHLLNGTIFEETVKIDSEIRTIENCDV